MEWIRTEKEKPLAGKSVLLWADSGEMGIGYLAYHSFADNRRYPNLWVNWHCGKKQFPLSKYPFWMPLPEPPKDFNKI